jgi:hypothetical protein
LEDLEAEVEINSAWETIRGNIKKIQLKRVWVIMNLKSISHASTKDAENYLIKGNKLNCRGYRIQVK